MYFTFLFWKETCKELQQNQTVHSPQVSSASSSFRSSSVWMKIFVITTSIHWWLWHLCHLVYIPAPKPCNTSHFQRELILSDAFKPTEQPESREKNPTLFLRDDPRHTADANWLPSLQENNQPPNPPAARNKMLNVREEWMHSLQFKLNSVAADTQLPQVLKQKLADNKKAQSF